MTTTYFAHAEAPEMYCVYGAETALDAIHQLVREMRKYATDASLVFVSVRYDDESHAYVGEAVAS